MLLLELFDKVLPWKWTEQGDTEATAEFTTPNGQRIRVYLYSYSAPTAEYPNDPETMELEFNNSGTTGSRMGTSKITDSGEQFLIFATVIDVAKSYMNEHPTTTIDFSADIDEPSRVKLYDKMMQKMAPNATREENPDVILYSIPPKQPRTHK